MKPRGLRRPQPGDHKGRICQCRICRNLPRPPMDPLNRSLIDEHPDIFGPGKPGHGVSEPASTPDDQLDLLDDS